MPQGRAFILDDGDYDLWHAGDFAETWRLAAAYPPRLISVTKGGLSYRLRTWRQPVASQMPKIRPASDASSNGNGVQGEVPPPSAP